MTGFTLKNVEYAGVTAGDLHIRGGLLVDEHPADSPTLDASGLIALPGLVDLHTHLRQPGDEAAETIETGTAAAARGGYTCVFAMPNTEPPLDNLRTLERLREASKQASAEVVPIATISKGRFGERVGKLAELADAGVRMFSDDGSCLLRAPLMREALATSREFGGVIAQHAQDIRLAGETACCHEGPVADELGLDPWPEVAESAIVARDIQLAIDTGGRLHVCHVSNAETVEVIRWAKRRGVGVSCEVTPHHLLLGEGLLRGQDTTFKVNPPLTSDENREALISALADGTIDVVATDHAPHTLESKTRPFQFAKPGMIGLEQALGVVIETMINPGLFGWGDVVRVMSATPASIGRVPHQGLPLTPGHPANMVLIDPTRRRVVNRDTSASKGRNNPYHGLDLPDPVVATIWRGRFTYREKD